MVQGTAQSQVKSIKINNISDIMSWTSGCKQSLHMLCHKKYLHYIFLHGQYLHKKER